MEHLSNDDEDHPNQHKNIVVSHRVISYAVKHGILLENISKNLQSFLEMCPVQKEVLSHKLQDHIFE